MPHFDKKDKPFTRESLRYAAAPKSAQVLLRKVAWFQ